MKLDPRENEDEMNEISMQARRNLAKAARRNAKRAARSRARKATKHKTKDELMAKARRMAIQILKKKILKDKKYEDLPFKQREMIDQRVKKVPANKLDALARKLLPKAKTADRERIQQAKDAKKQDSD